jgi:hypothetical protein
MVGRVSPPVVSPLQGLEFWRCMTGLGQKQRARTPVLHSIVANGERRTANEHEHDDEDDGAANPEGDSPQRRRGHEGWNGMKGLALRSGLYFESRAPLGTALYMVGRASPPVVSPLQGLDFWRCVTGGSVKSNGRGRPFYIRLSRTVNGERRTANEHEHDDEDDGAANPEGDSPQRRRGHEGWNGMKG